METAINQAATPDSAPVAAKDRNQALDVTRGFAVLGILLVNVYMAGQFEMLAMSSALLGDLSQSDQSVWSWVNVFLLGPSRALFSLMFGAGMVLLLDRLSLRLPEKMVKKIYFRRLWVLLMIALVDLFIFLWWGDILNGYALAGMVLYYLRNASTKKLMVWASIFMLMASAMFIMLAVAKPMYDQAMESQAAGETLTPEQKGLVEGMAPMFDPEKQREMQNEQTTAFLGGITDTAPALWLKSVQTLLVANFAMVLWDSLFMMVLGIWAYRKGWLTGEGKLCHYRKMAAYGLGIGLGFRYWVFSQMGTPEFDSAFMLNSILYQPSRMFLAFGYLGLIQMFALSSWGQAFKKVMASVGQMALTNYLMHSLLYIFLFYGVGLGLYGQLSGLELIGLALAIFIAQMVISHVWLKTYRFGPFEWLWRSLTYGKRQPLKR